MTSKSTLKMLATTLVSALIANADEAPDPNVHGDPYIPVGTLAVNQTFVTTGVKPKLMWNIEYPTSFSDLALVSPTGALSTTNKVSAEVRVLGVDLKDQENRGDLPVILWIRVGGAGSPWEQVFYGSTKNVNPSQVLYHKWVDPGTQIDMAAQGKTDSGSWGTSVWTIEDSGRLVHLANQEAVPDHIAAFSGQEVKGFTSAILTEDQSSVAIGPKDMAYFFELSSEDPSASDFDLQDLVVLVQLNTNNNNGHGNNLDGVDVSNPGEGAGGANGEIDESGSVDDEIRTSAM